MNTANRIIMAALLSSVSLAGLAQVAKAEMNPCSYASEINPKQNLEYSANDVIVLGKPGCDVKQSFTITWPSGETTTVELLTEELEKSVGGEYKATGYATVDGIRGRYSRSLLATCVGYGNQRPYQNMICF